MKIVIEVIGAVLLLAVVLPGSRSAPAADDLVDAAEQGDDTDLEQLDTASWSGCWRPRSAILPTGITMGLPAI